MLLQGYAEIAVYDVILLIGYSVIVLKFYAKVLLS